jgi:hypothetical protein
VLPLIDLLTSSVEKLAKSHFSLMFDDAEALSDYQNTALNTWIASRDTSKLSFKVATSLVDQKPLCTSTGGSLLERHDFIRVDMEKDFQNTEAAFHKLAKEIVEKRLVKYGINKTAEEFFPINTQMAADLRLAEISARQDAVKRFPDGTSKQIGDYVYKYGRAYYFRSRSSKANRPPYSGFSLIVHVSTGVIRYLLEPCYEMFDAALSRIKDPSKQIQFVEPSVQTECLEVLSKRRWDWIKQGFNDSIRKCNRVDAKHLFQLLDNLSVFLKYRLQNHRSEPRAITFSVAGQGTFSGTEQLFNLLEIARRAQILFKRTSSGKDDGRRETYYTFDRLLWIERGLDPIGQNACVSVEARYLWSAAFENKPIPTGPKGKIERDKSSTRQTEMFSSEGS